jgi:prefoldin subunit 5
MQTAEKVLVEVGTGYFIEVTWPVAIVCFHFMR